WPLVQEARAQWLSGQFPFWASSVCNGTPLLANINAGVLYPLRLIHNLLPLPFGYQFFLAAHVWLSLFGMHVLLHRRLRLQPLAAAIGAIAFTACGYARGMWDTHNFVALPWIPLGLAALLGCAAGGQHRLRGMAGAALCWTLLLLGGDFQAAVLWLPVAALLAVLHPHRRQLLPALGVVALIGALLSAPQWLPTWRATAESYRAAGMPYAEAIERSLHPLRLVEWCVPHLFGNRATWFGDALTAADGGAQLPWTSSVHVGRFACGLAILAFAWRRRRPSVRWAGLLVLGGTLLSFGGYLPGYREWLSLPIVGTFRYPTKYMLWASLGLAVLAAYGANAWLALLRAGRARLAVTLTIWWFCVLALAWGGGAWLLRSLAPAASGAGAWANSAGIVLAALLGIAVAGMLLFRDRRNGVALVMFALVFCDSATGWFTETPTTSRWTPLAAPPVAQFIRASDAASGRVLRDPAVQGAPSHADLQRLSPQERAACFMRDVLDFNSARLWGLRTADGFSPIESATMRAYRLQMAKPVRSGVPAPQDLATFCQMAGVVWLITTGERAAALDAAGLQAEVAATWGPADAFVLLRMPDASEAVCMPALASGGAVSGPEVLGLYRARPGSVRVDLSPGGATQLIVRETWSGGWRAVDQSGAVLALAASPEGFMQLQLPAGVRQVRLQYAPAGWGMGLGFGLLGLLCLVGLVVTRENLHARVRQPGVAIAVCVGVALAIGVGARAHWACTFDEGFHLTRGTMLQFTGDSRLSYFHPPLQNFICAGVAKLAFGEQVTVPRGEAWETSNLWFVSRDLALQNQNIYRQMIAAARWGTSLFAALAIGVGTWWGFRARGPLAGWLAGIGLALSPSLLAHGNLITTDMGLTAFAMLGTALLWRATAVGDDGGKAFPLWPATLAFVAAVLTKHSGLVWFLGYILLAIPVLAVARRSPRPLWQILLGGLFFLVLFAALYGVTPQQVRVPDTSWWSGKSFPGGRYVEGLISQTQHSVGGQRAFFHGERLVSSPWWVNVAQLGLKNPPLWCLAALAGLVAWCGRRRPLRMWVPVLPAIFFAAMWMGPNHLAIGVRHALSLVALGTVLGAIWAAGLTQRTWRTALCGALVLAALAAASAYPHFISYYPAWAGGVSHGQRWMVDSNYDWGQDLDTLEKHWAELIDANGGKPPHLIYFGFLDPSTIYGMPVAQPSLLGFMTAGRWPDPALLKGLGTIDATVVASISSLELNPYGVDFAELRAAPRAGRVGNAFYVVTPGVAVQQGGAGVSMLARPPPEEWDLKESR
ncbi:MAG: hypothetical protein O3B24_08405, partial [Verrucomicrobia bacterium]|nr:hypothetical protein [Verrucomicrobiota bacterium]